MREQFLHYADSTLTFAIPCCAHAAGVVARKSGRVCRPVSPCIRKWETSSDAVPAAAYSHLCRAVDDGEGARFSAMCALHWFERRVQLWHGHRFQPDNGKCLFCGGGHQIVAVIAFCWREPHADMCRPQIEQAEKTQRRQPVRGPLTDKLEPLSETGSSVN